MSEQLAQAKRNFEVGVATITDTNEAQAKYDQIVAQEITARNDLDNRRTALRAIIGRMPQRPEARSGRGFEPALPEPNVARLLGRPRAAARTSTCASRSPTTRSRRSRSTAQRAGHCPTLDLVGSCNAQGANSGGRPSSDSAATRARRRSASQLNVPIYQGGFVDSRVREAIALQDNARQNLEAARRVALFNAQDRLLRRQQRGGVGEGVRAGGRVGGGRARVEHRSARKSACAPTSTC